MAALAVLCGSGDGAVERLRRAFLGRAHLDQRSGVVLEALQLLLEIGALLPERGLRLAIGLAKIRRLREVLVEKSGEEDDAIGALLRRRGVERGIAFQDRAERTEIRLDQREDGFA